MHGGSAIFPLFTFRCHATTALLPERLALSVAQHDTLSLDFSRIRNSLHRLLSEDSQSASSYRDRVFVNDESVSYTKPVT